MSVAVLISGSIFRQPEQRTSQSGKRYVTTTIKAAAADNSASDFWNALAFGDTAGAELMRLGVNERIAVQGSLKLETYTKDGETKISRTVFVDSVLALRAPPREKRPKKPAAPEGLPIEPVNIVPAAAPAFDDDIPF
jgi:single-stranded DNA-binding protein